MSRVQTQAWSQTGSARDHQPVGHTRLACEDFRQLLGRFQDPAARGSGKLSEPLRIGSRIEEFGGIVEQLKVDAVLSDALLTVLCDELQTHRLQRRSGVLKDDSGGGRRQLTAIGVVGQTQRELRAGNAGLASTLPEKSR